MIVLISDATSTCRFFGSPQCAP